VRTGQAGRVDGAGIPRDRVGSPTVVVDRFHLADWAQVISLLHTSGPAEIIRRVRQAEDHHAVPADDASIAHCTELG
jgi:hypothetical protein